MLNARDAATAVMQGPENHTHTHTHKVKAENEGYGIIIRAHVY